PASFSHRLSPQERTYTQIRHLNDGLATPLSSSAEVTAVTYPMTDEDREIQARARKFVDEELIPFEVDAEMNAGEIDPAAKERQSKLAKELGLFAMNMPRSLGGTEMTMFQQTLVSEQIGRVTNALG